ncbi:TIGR03560 family F420-dependent LLM class oxidoreductase [Nocardia seriolae]|uniref:Alkanesulfonate monooxygenase n=1 Tax=Nocardia seriolae TaxID=37332 RepID=A0A0B8NFJ8_9NOCA|nr:TIGR03560 family F420-dependent LLM class oxidoreductase [Nocardia seriolae]APA94398.1 Alkanesulfonate monooxygenase [Nocardia seriolae]MTJ66589.1 TIGR03560 family F420-dependent LLM class oxidoreductase [Nocardia seriolae]MTJ71917.1 TIGR03560 family F420-dependent LLM class oxidoreductase [Nocardia seriolae]MTJ84718.1 TIGR03560 family F420-dependent LLM class oxidoreductase [Nocardia seriolae]MTK28706.1 TIGR03560 family F420-dependent LLM class oxidoreductase [Nocardia seriolae]
MELGLHLTNFALDTPSELIGPRLAEVVRTAEDSGFSVIAVGDHLWQSPWLGRVEQNVLEAYSTLSFIAAHTARVELTALVSGVHYRHPAMLAKLVGTLDVLSGGRAWLGIGAGTSTGDVEGYGLPFPPLRERYEMLEETLRICEAMWSDARGASEPVSGKHFHVQRPLNAPQVLRTSPRRPRPPILIGGDGERRTLPLVARYADVASLRPGPDLPAKLDLLNRLCGEIGRDPREIRKSCVFVVDPGPTGGGVAQVLGQLKWLADMGIDLVIARVAGVDDISPLEVLGREVVPAVAEFGR